MSKKIKTVFLFLILVLICGFFIWQHYQKIENKYNDMLAIYKEQKMNNNSEGIINVSFDGQATFQSYRE